MITQVNLIEVIQKHIELPQEVISKLAKDLYDHMAPHLYSKSKVIPVKNKKGLTTGDLEEILVAVQKLKDIHSSIEPKYLEDVVYVDRLKQLEFIISEVLFKHK